MKIIEVTDPKEKSKICESILRSLPNWFGIESAINDYVEEVKAFPMWTAKNETESIGFISVKNHNQWTSEIHVMAVKEKNHNQGIGKALLKTAEQSLKTQNKKYLTVKTLSESKPNKEYTQTRIFYYNTGFTPVEEFKTLWNESNPCLLMIKNLK